MAELTLIFNNLWGVRATCATWSPGIAAFVQVEAICRVFILARTGRETAVAVRLGLESEGKTRARAFNWWLGFW
jgi:hypothetical protein